MASSRSPSDASLDTPAVVVDPSVDSIRDATSTGWTRREDPTATVDAAQAAGFAGGHAADVVDAVAAHQHVGAPAGLAGAVDEKDVAQQQAIR